MIETSRAPGPTSEQYARLLEAFLLRDEDSARADLIVAGLILEGADGRCDLCGEELTETERIDAHASRREWGTGACSSCLHSWSVTP